MECLKCLYLSSVDTVADDLASKVAHMMHKRACVDVIHLNVHIQFEMVSCAVCYSYERLVLMG